MLTGGRGREGGVWLDRLRGVSGARGGVAPRQSAAPFPLPGVVGREPEGRSDCRVPWDGNRCLLSVPPVEYQDETVNTVRSGG